MTTSFVKLAAAAAIGLFATVAMAQTPAPKPAAPAAAAPAPAMKPAAPAMKPAAPAPAAAAPATATPASAAKPRSAKSLECSKEADAKAIHGKVRHKFMSECKKGKTAG
ncbi:psiF repeat-containing protein [Rhizobiales bacterium GAS188]|nr:psiF repeat-containing protein [Rhizobiales bacterium GAS188]